MTRIVVDVACDPSLPFLLVPVEVNGQGAESFILDTGAARTVLSKEFAATAGITVQRTETIMSAGGPIDVEVGASTTISVGGLEQPRPVTIADMSSIQAAGIDAKGVLGVDYLRSYAVTIDRKSLQLGLSTSIDQPETAAVPIAFTFGSKMPLVLLDAFINDTGPWVVGLDTGAIMSIISPDVQRAADVALHDTASAVGAGGAFEIEIGTARIALGRVQRDVSIGIAPVEHLGMAVGATMSGLIGQDILTDTRLHIDYRSMQLTITE